MSILNTFLVAGGTPYNPFDLKYATSAEKLFYQADLSELPSKWIINAPNLIFAKNMLSLCTTNKDVEIEATYGSLADMQTALAQPGLKATGGKWFVTKITAHNTATVTNLNGTFQRNANSYSPRTREVVIDFATANVTVWSYTFRCTQITGRHNADALTTISGTPLDFTSATTANGVFSSCDALEDVRFVASSIHIDISIADSPNLTNDTLVSLANGLNENESNKTLTLHADSKAKLSSIMGFVVDGVFTANAQGDTSLQAFMTTNKGWTVA